MSTNLAVVNQRAVPAVTFGEMQELANSIAKSGLFGMKTPEQALALMAIAQAEGRHPALAARDYDIIQGRPAKKAEAMLRDFLESGGKVEWHALDDTQADATFSHPSGGSVRITWDAARAKQAQLTGKDMYKKYPRQMFRSRCVSEGVRTVCPAATSGLYVPEEVADFDAKRAVDVTPAKAALTPPSAPRTALTEAEERDLDRESMRQMRGETVEGEEAPPETVPRRPNDAASWAQRAIAKVRSIETVEEYDAWYTEAVRGAVKRLGEHDKALQDELVKAISDALDRCNPVAA